MASQDNDNDIRITHISQKKYGDPEATSEIEDIFTR